MLNISSRQIGKMQVVVTSDKQVIFNKLELPDRPTNEAINTGYDTELGKDRLQVTGARPPGARMGHRKQQDGEDREEMRILPPQPQKKQTNGIHDHKYHGNRWSVSYLKVMTSCLMIICLMNVKKIKWN